MKKVFKHAFLFFLLAFVAFACSKESDEVNPTASLSGSLANNVQIGGYTVGLLTKEGNGVWSFTIAGPGAGVQGAGLSHLDIKLTDCDGNLVPLSASYIATASIKVGNQTFTPGNGITLGYSDGSCTSPGVVDQNLLKLDLSDALGELLKAGSGTVYFTFADPYKGIKLQEANILVKTGMQQGEMCFTSNIGTYDDYCTEEPPRNCALSQGYFFASPHAWCVEKVKIGGKYYTEAEGRAIFRSSNAKGGIADAKAAFLQLGALYLNEACNDEFEMPAELAAAVQTIETYLRAQVKLTPQNVANMPSNKAVKAAAGKIGDWISENHCD